MDSAETLALVIEDHADTAEMFVKALEAAGFATLAIGDGQEALARLPALRPVLITLDLQLPHVPGEQILAQIKTDDRLAQTRIILVTGEQQLAAHLKEQVDLVLLKPVRFDQLRDLAARWRSRKGFN